MIRSLALPVSFNPGPRGARPADGLPAGGCRSSPGGCVPGLRAASEPDLGGSVPKILTNNNLDQFGLFLTQNDELTNLFVKFHYYVISF